MSGEGTYLERILAAKRAELSSGPGGAVSDRELDRVLAEAGPTRDFEGALREGAAPRVIAEFKRASPSAGTIREGADPQQIATQYAGAGASAISVLCDRHFEGSLEDLRAVRAAVSLPVLCKDFILDRRQLVEARRAGADAVLLIVAALEPPRLRPLVEAAHDLGLHVLCETHDEHEVDRAMAAGARVVGVNSRDLRTFEVDLQRCVDLRRLVPADRFVYVAESGIAGPADVERLRDAGVDAILVGTHLMAADDPGEALRALVARGA